MTQPPHQPRRCIACERPMDEGREVRFGQQWGDACPSCYEVLRSEPVGPTYCQDCGSWPASTTDMLCHLCASRRWAAAHPVPLPENPDYLLDLASIGVPGALDKLEQKMKL